MPCPDYPCMLCCGTAISLRIPAQSQAAVAIIKQRRASDGLDDKDSWPPGWSADGLDAQIANFDPESIVWDFSGLHDGGSTDLQKFTLKPGIRTTFSAKLEIYPTYQVRAAARDAAASCPVIPFTTVVMRSPPTRQSLPTAAHRCPHRGGCTR